MEMPKQNRKKIPMKIMKNPRNLIMSLLNLIKNMCILWKGLEDL
jgi:hypothetical protein